MRNSIRVFTLYAKEDESYMEELTLQLRRMRRKGVITEYCDQEISRVKNWDPETRVSFESCDYMLFMVSPALLSSGYQQDDYIQMALEAGKQGHLTIIPVLIKGCNLYNEPLGQFLALPSNSQPVLSHYWEDRQNAWRDVSEGLELLIRGENPFEEPDGWMMPAASDTIQPIAVQRNLPWQLQVLLSIVVFSGISIIIFYVRSFHVIDKVSNNIKSQNSFIAQPAAFNPRELPKEDDYIEIEDAEDELLPEENFYTPGRKLSGISSYKQISANPKKETVKAAVDTVAKLTPREPEPVSIKLSIRSEQLEELLMDFSQRKIREEEISPYLCLGLQTPVRFGNESIDFQRLCDALKEVKAKKIKKIQIVSATYDNGCISSLEVIVKKRGFMNSVFKSSYR